MTPRDVVKSVPIFASVLDAAQLDALATHLTLKEIPKGAVLMRQGEMGTSMFAIVRGAASVTVHVSGGKETVATLGPGDVVGEISLLTGAYRNATVTATKGLTVLEIAKADLQAVLSEHPGLIPRFAGVIEQRQAEMKRIRSSAAHWDAIGLDRLALENLMRGFYKS